MNKKISKDLNKPLGRTINSKSNKTLKSDFTNGFNKTIITNKNSDKYYKCYSVKLNEFLKSNSIHPLKEAKHPKTGKTAFIYERTIKLDELLTIWTKNRDELPERDSM